MTMKQTWKCHALLKGTTAGGVHKVECVLVPHPLSLCYRLAFCPVGTWCVSGTAGGAIDVWDTTTLKLRQHVAQEDSIVRLAFVPATPVRLWWRGFWLLHCVVGMGCSLALYVCVCVCV